MFSPGFKVLYPATHISESRDTSWRLSAGSQSPSRGCWSANVDFSKLSAELLTPRGAGRITEKVGKTHTLYLPSSSANSRSTVRSICPVFCMIVVPIRDVAFFNLSHQYGIQVAGPI